MKLHEYKDSSGLVMLSLMCDSDTDPSVGIPVETVALDGIELSDEEKIALHNHLMRRRLITWKDVERLQSGLRASVIALSESFDIPAGRQQNIVRALQAKFKDRR